VRTKTGSEATSIIVPLRRFAPRWSLSVPLLFLHLTLFTKNNRYKIAYANCSLLFRGDHLGRFLIGRQICVTSCMFVVAKITSPDAGLIAVSPDGNIFGVSNNMQDFFNYGFCGGKKTKVKRGANDGNEERSEGGYCCASSLRSSCALVVRSATFIIATPRTSRSLCIARRRH